MKNCSRCGADANSGFSIEFNPNIVNSKIDWISNPHNQEFEADVFISNIHGLVRGLSAEMCEGYYCANCKRRHYSICRTISEKILSRHRDYIPYAMDKSHRAEPYFSELYNVHIPNSKLEEKVSANILIRIKDVYADSPMVMGEIQRATYSLSKDGYIPTNTEIIENIDKYIWQIYTIFTKTPKNIMDIESDMLSRYALAPYEHEKNSHLGKKIEKIISNHARIWFNPILKELNKTVNILVLAATSNFMEYR